jgi:hypothetical protein
MRKFVYVPLFAALVISMLTLGACSKNNSSEVTSQIPNGEVVTIKSVTPERDFSLFVVADRDDYGQKDMEFYVSAESPPELHELIKANVGKKIRIAWADGLISAAEELSGEMRFVGPPSESNSSDSDSAASAGNGSNDEDNVSDSGLSAGLIDELKVRGNCLGAYQLSAMILKQGGDDVFFKDSRRQASYQFLLIGRALGDMDEATQAEGFKIVNASTMSLVNQLINSQPDTPERSSALSQIKAATQSDECKIYKNADQQKYITDFIKDMSEEELEEMDRRNNKASN